MSLRCKFGLHDWGVIRSWTTAFFHVNEYRCRRCKRMKRKYR